MNKRTAKALEESIEKWRQIERGEMADLGIENCSLCMEFFFKGCLGCPVRHKTGLRDCRGTPYTPWLAGSPVDWPKVADTPELVELARAERKFLESLRDKK